GDGDGSIALRPYDLTRGGLRLDSLDFSAPAGALAKLEQAIDVAGSAADALAVQAMQVELHTAAVGRLSETLQGGAEASLSSDGARLQALQIRQILQNSGQSIANQNPNSLLALFRA